MHYSVESVETRRVCPDTGTVQYLLKWEGYDNMYNSWEPRRNLVCCSDVVSACDARESRVADALTAEHVLSHSTAEEGACEAEGAPLYLRVHDESFNAPDSAPRTASFVRRQQSSSLQPLQVFSLRCGESMLMPVEREIHSTLSAAMTSNGYGPKNSMKYGRRKRKGGTVSRNVGSDSDDDDAQDSDEDEESALMKAAARARVASAHERSWCSGHSEGLFRLACLTQRVAWWHHDRSSLGGLRIPLVTSCVGHSAERSPLDSETNKTPTTAAMGSAEPETVKVLSLVPAWALSQLEDDVDINEDSGASSLDDDDVGTVSNEADTRRRKRPRTAPDSVASRNAMTTERSLRGRRCSASIVGDVESLLDDELVVHYYATAVSRLFNQEGSDDSFLLKESAVMPLSIFREQHPQQLLDFLLEHSLLMTTTTASAVSSDPSPAAANTDAGNAEATASTGPLDAVEEEKRQKRRRRVMCSDTNKETGLRCREFAVTSGGGEQFDRCPSHLFSKLGEGRCSAKTRQTGRSCPKRVAWGLDVCCMHYRQATVDPDQPCSEVTSPPIPQEQPEAADRTAATPPNGIACGEPAAIGHVLCPFHFAQRHHHHTY